jgi:anti-sigma-K factor RskA
VFGSRLATPTGDKVYELWYRTSADSPMRPAGTFVPDDGSVVAPVTLGPTIQAFAVSIEPAGGSPSPTSAPVLFTTVA